MEGGDAPAFDLGNVNRHDFGSYQIEPLKNTAEVNSFARAAGYRPSCAAVRAPRAARPPPRHR
jgi:hypothetical protein